MENKLKRKRTANFTAEEKMRLVRLLCEEGQCILSKVTAHDATTNKEKEMAWTKITQIYNSSGDMMRTTETLKKLWGKLKTAAKTHKKHSVSDTGGGPPSTFDDSLMELVADMIYQASTSILVEKKEIADASPPIEYLDERISMEDFPEDKVITINEDYSNKKGMNFNRRPEITHSNERMEKIKNHKKISNRFAAEQLKAEQEKTNLIMQEKKLSAELYGAKLENEKIKKEILLTLLKKVMDADTDKDVAKLARQYMFESE